jgi:CHAT domain-containing protein/tetratricopeptide (TPR) repeat protein
MTALGNQMRALYQAGKYEEGIPIAQRVLGLIERQRGQNHLEYANALQFLGEFYRAAGRYAEAEPIIKRAVAVAEKVRGANHLDVAPFLYSLGDLYRWQGRYKEADPHLQRAVAILEKAHGPSHPQLAPALSRLGLSYGYQERYAEAESIHKRALALAEKAKGPNDPVVFEYLMNLGELVNAVGRYTEAEQHIRRAHTIAVTSQGQNHVMTGRALRYLAKVRAAQGRLADAEAFYRETLAIYEKALGQSNPLELMEALNDLGKIVAAQGHYAEAERLHGRVLIMQDKVFGKSNAQIGVTISYLGDVYAARGRFAEADAAYRRALDMVEKVLGPKNTAVAIILNAMGLLNGNSGRFKEAEAFFKRAVAVAEATQGPEHRNVAQGLTNLASLYRSMGNYPESEALLRRATEIAQKALGPNHHRVAEPVAVMAQLYLAQGRRAEAEPLFQRALSVTEAGLGGEHPTTASMLNSLGDFYRESGRFAEAEQRYRRALAIRQKVFGPNAAAVGESYHNLGMMYLMHGRIAEAEAHFARSLSIRERALPPDHPLIAMSLTYVGIMHVMRDKPGDAEPLLMRALNISEKGLGADHPFMAKVSNALAAVLLEKGDYSLALSLFKRSAAILIKRSQSTGEAIGRGVSGRLQTEAISLGWGTRSLVQAAHRLGELEPARAGELEQEMFINAQWATGGEAAASIAQMAVRQAAGDSGLARLVRERQDLVAEWRERDTQLAQAIANPSAARGAAAEQPIRARLAAIGNRMAEIDRTLTLDFPQYSALTNPQPIGLSEAQRLLGADEALVLLLDAPEIKPLPEATFVWVVTKSATRWVKSPIKTKALTESVSALRCGLDANAWTGNHCPNLLKVTSASAGREAGTPPPFDVARAHDLYRGLFSQVEDLIKGKHLLLVPSGPLTALPFQVLVTAPPADAANLAKVSWLGVRQPMTVLPSVASLRALRSLARSSGATRPFIGFGNPLLEGNPAVAWQTALARQSRDYQRCGPSRVQQVAALPEGRGAIKALARGGLADVAQIKQQVPLPETAIELCAIAETLGVPASEIRLGASATETELKALSSAGRLADYRVVHFATHGALSGEVGGSSEPGLILTPPGKATDADDGYLTASEIAQMKLDADWVILSACNTAGGGEQGGEALSGLARAFFYAGARALLVSHWAVDSAATVRLITEAFAQLQRDPKIGRAEAMRRSAIALISSGEPLAAHPAYWAPFVVVGEGARR